MLETLDFLRGINFLSVVVRLMLAVICGGVIGIERAYKRRPAGFRTHILICLGAAMTTLTSQYLSIYMSYTTDISRLGAHVIAGIGFIGAGTIIVTKRQRVKGLTTAAGLWTAAIIGLVLGSGYFEAGILATVLIMAAELLFSKIEYRILHNTREINLFIEYNRKNTLEKILAYCAQNNLKVLDIEVTRQGDSDPSSKVHPIIDGASENGAKKAKAQEPQGQGQAQWQVQPQDHGQAQAPAQTQVQTQIFGDDESGTISEETDRLKNYAFVILNILLNRQVRLEEVIESLAAVRGVISVDKL